MFLCVFSIISSKPPPAYGRITHIYGKIDKDSSGNTKKPIRQDRASNKEDYFEFLVDVDSNNFFSYNSCRLAI